MSEGHRDAGARKIFYFALTVLLLYQYAYKPTGVGQYIMSSIFKFSNMSLLEFLVSVSSAYVGGSQHVLRVNKSPEQPHQLDSPP